MGISLSEYRDGDYFQTADGSIYKIKEIIDNQSGLMLHFDADGIQRIVPFTNSQIHPIPLSAQVFNDLGFYNSIDEPTVFRDRYTSACVAQSKNSDKIYFFEGHENLPIQQLHELQHIFRDRRYYRLEFLDEVKILSGARNTGI